MHPHRRLLIILNWRTPYFFSPSYSPSYDPLLPLLRPTKTEFSRNEKRRKKSKYFVNIQKCSYLCSVQWNEELRREFLIFIIIHYI